MRLWIPLAMPALFLSAPLQAAAQAPAPNASVNRAAEAPVSPPAPRPLDLTELGQISGGQAVTVAVTDQALRAVNAGNSITAGTVRSGDINFSQAALSNFAGVGNFVMNTGNNNNLQGSLSVTVVAAPAALR